jgi:hypothetical protein
MLVLSGTESFCITAAESMINGIPVLYTKPTGTDFNPNVQGTTEGVEEWIEPVGIAIPRNDTELWVSEILKLDDPDVYVKKSEECRTHAEPLFGTSGIGADSVLSFANANPVRTNSMLSVRNERPQVEPLTLSVVPLRPSQPAAWRNGRLTFGRR